MMNDDVWQTDEIIFVACQYGALLDIPKWGKYQIFYKPTPHKIGAKTLYFRPFHRWMEQNYFVFPNTLLWYFVARWRAGTWLTAEKDCTSMDLHSSLLIAIICPTYNNTMVCKFSDIAKAPTGKTLKILWMRIEGSCWGIVHLEWSERYFSSSAVEDHCSFVVRGSFNDSNGNTHVKAIRFF
jgi:hypothetical protein